MAKIKVHNTAYFLLLSVPLINMGFDFFLTGSGNRSLMVLLQYLILGTVIAFNFLVRKKIEFIDIVIYCFLIYLFISIQFSSDFFTSLNYFIKVAITYMMFTISYKVIDDIPKFKGFLKVNFVLMGIFLGYISISNYLGIGESFYGDDDELTTGYLGGMRLYQIILPLYLLPLLKYLNWNKNTKRIVLFIALITFIALPVISLRRTPTIAWLLGALFFFLFVKQRTKYFLWGTVAAAILLVFTITFSDLLIQRFAVRQNKFERVLSINEITSKEDRFREYGAVINQIEGDIITMFFGTKELFNTRNNYGPGFYYNRRLHVDFTSLLFGGGVIGLTLYFFIIFMQYKNISHYSNLRKFGFYSKVYAIGMLLIPISLFIALTGGIESISYRSMLFIMLGAVYGVLKNSNKSLTAKSN